MSQPRTNRPHGPAGAGFTLVELLIATAVSGLLIAAAGLVLAAGMRTFAAASATGEAELRDVRLVALLVADVTSAMPLNGVPFVGDATELSFPRLISPSRQGGDVTIVQVRWAYDARRGWRRTLTFPDGRTSGEGFGMMPGARLAYTGSGDASGRGDAAETVWRETWTDRRFPESVRLTADGLSLELAPACVFEHAGAGGVQE